MDGISDVPTAQALHYEYSPLPSPTDIRLVELQPCSDGAISITLMITKLENAPMFDALSYTWGNPYSPYLGESTTTISWETADVAILCNRKKLFIASNLRDALHMLQKNDWRSETVPRQRYIWIDALCIDQSNLSEREAQVSLMGELYRKATTVIAWLGDADFSTSDAFAVVDRLSSVAQERHSSVKMDDFLVEEAYSQKLGIAPVSPMQWLALLMLLHRPFFERAWIVQEAFNAKAFVLVCGKMLLPWRKLSAAIQLIINTGWFFNLYTEKMRIEVINGDPGPYTELLSVNTNPGYGAVYLIQAKAAIEASGRQYALQMLLRQHRNCKASDPRDKIYAFLGIARRDAKPFTTHIGLLNPDYRIPVQQLYTRTARCLLQSYGDLRFLCEKEPHVDTRLNGLPSWVPDYNIQLQADPITRRAPSSNWSAAGGLPWQPDSRDADDPLLGVQGTFLGSIVELSEDPTMRDGGDPNVANKFWGSMCAVCFGLEDYYSVSPES
jgi:Heterokaryon incompatibility protein (HET)